MTMLQMALFVLGIGAAATLVGCTVFVMAGFLTGRVMMRRRKTVVNPFVCWLSAIGYDLHDYPVECGGDGTPSHFYTYKCPECGKEFGI